MVHYPVHISPDLGGAILSFSYDLSESGTYVPLNDHQEKFVNVGDKTTLFFKVSENENIKYEAEIVRVSKQKGLYPNGVGLRFTNLNAQKKKDIKRLIQLSNFGQPQA
jgi:c-di-GMP-binding flagellar brake protein YcgR